MLSGIVAQAQRNSWEIALEANGEDVTYRISETKEIQLRAILTKPKTKTTDGNEVALVETKKWDWLIDACSLIDPVTNTAFEPKRGHSIERCDGTRYRLVPGDGSDLLWRWGSSAKIFRRVHCEEF